MHVPVLMLTITPKTQADQKKLAEGLSALMADDPTLRVQDSEHVGQTVIAGIGELHLEIVADRLRREFGVEAVFGDPQVIYRPSLDATGVVTLEPIMRVEVTVPKEPVTTFGSVLGTLLGRSRRRMQGSEDLGSTVILKARVPLAKMLGYGADLRARTQGRATYSMQLDGYEPVAGGSESEGDRDSNVRVPLTPRPSPRSSAVELPEPGGSH